MRKMSKAEAGKIGAEKSKITAEKNRLARIQLYEKNPSQCKQCEASLDYTDRKKTFCSSSCSATYNNTRRKTRADLVSWRCENCGKEHTAAKWRAGKYCDNVCSAAHRSSVRVEQWINEGKDWKAQVPGWVKKYLQEIRSEGCEICGIVEWNNKPISLECDHIDGDHTNNRPENLRIICPNCHSQTDTYKAKNTGKGRKYRRR